MRTPFVADIESNIRSSMIGLLNQHLVNAIDLKLALKQAHWNIRGSEFIALHELFDQVAGRIEDHSDTIAERVVQLGGVASGTAQAVAGSTSLPAYPSEATAQREHLEALHFRLAAFAKTCRNAIDEADQAGDADTADIMTGISRSTDKDLWFVAAHLE
jgi:starvation-inducible DNA-binding protein